MKLTASPRSLVASFTLGVAAQRRRVGPNTRFGGEDLHIVPGLLRFTGAVKRDPAIAIWLAAQPGDLRALAKPWLARMRRCGADVRELMHDGLATVCVGDCPFAYVGAFTAHVTVGFFHGGSLPDRAGLLKGNGRHMRHVKLKPGVAFDESALEALIAAAYSDTGIRRMLAEQDIGPIRVPI